MSLPRGKTHPYRLSDAANYTFAYMHRDDLLRRSQHDLTFGYKTEQLQLSATIGLSLGEPVHMSKH